MLPSVLLLDNIGITITEPSRWVWRMPRISAVVWLLDFTHLTDPLLTHEGAGY